MGPSTLCDASREGGVTRREWVNIWHIYYEGANQATATRELIVNDRKQ